MNTEAVATIRGVVRAIDGGEAVVEVEQGGCGRCHEPGGCGGQQLTQALCSGPKTYRVNNPAGAGIGEQVTVAVASGAVRRGANLAYVLPLLALVGGAAIGTQAVGDLGGIVGGSTGLVVAWFFLRIRMRGASGNSDIRPYIVSRSHSPS